MTIYINHADQGDIPAVLRQLADDIENAWIDQAERCVIVIEAKQLVVEYAGPGEAAPNAHLLLCKGAAKIAGAK